MTEPQKEYIITEEQLSKIHTGLKPNPDGEGHGATHIPMAWYEIKNELELVLSRPYTSAEKVLERLDELIKFHEQYPRKSLYTNGFIIAELKELRQERDR